VPPVWIDHPTFMQTIYVRFTENVSYGILAIAHQERFLCKLILVGC